MNTTEVEDEKFTTYSLSTRERTHIHTLTYTHAQCLSTVDDVQVCDNWRGMIVTW